MFPRATIHDDSSVCGVDEEGDGTLAEALHFGGRLPCVTKGGGPVQEMVVLEDRGG